MSQRKEKSSQKPERFSHGFPPAYEKDSTILILGSFPSVASRSEGFYYAHKQNRFWAMLALLYHEERPESIAEKQLFLARHHLALYDTIESCEVIGSSDLSISKVVPADLSWCPASIKTILLNGKTAGKLFAKYQNSPAGISVHTLPSTSPANAAFSLKELLHEWGPFLLDN